MRTTLGCVALVLLTGAVAAADNPGAVDGKKLPGKWEPKDANKDVKLMVEFGKDGKMNIVSAGGGKEFKIPGTYQLDGNKLSMTFKRGDMDVTETVTITKLTDEVLEGENGKGRKEAFVRAKP